MIKILELQRLETVEAESADRGKSTFSVHCSAASTECKE